MTEEKELSVEEKEAVFDYLSKNQSFPTPEEKYNVHLFLHRVATADDTTKVGNLKEEELGTPRHPLRASKEFALISEKIIGNDFFKEYFEKESEILTSTSLSKEGFLIKQATTQTKQVADVTKKRKLNAGWFKKKEENENEKS